MRWDDRSLPDNRGYPEDGVQETPPMTGVRHPVAHHPESLVDYMWPGSPKPCLPETISRQAPTAGSRVAHRRWMVLGDHLCDVRQQPTMPRQIECQQSLFTAELQNPTEPAAFQIRIASDHSTACHEAEHSPAGQLHPEVERALGHRHACRIDASL